MKTKKVKRKSRNSLHDVSNASNTNDPTDEAFQPDGSSKDEKIPSHFTVLFDPNSTESKQVLSKNIVFLHPIIIETYKYPKYFILKGATNIALCLPIPLKRVEKSSAFLPKEDLGFSPGELVKLLSYHEHINKASNVCVCFDGKITVNDDIKEKVLEALMSKCYYCKGMKIKGKYLTEFCITEINSKEHELAHDMSSLNISDIRNESINLCDASFSLNDSRLTNLLRANFDESIDAERTVQNSTELNSLFSKLNLGDKEDSFVDNSDNPCDTEKNFSEFEVQEFFTSDFTTSVSIDSEENGSIASTPSFSQIGGLKEELQYIRLLINEFLNHERNQRMFGAVMLLGPSGIGKTLILEAIHFEYKVPIEEITWSSLYAKSFAEAKQELHRIFQRINNRDQCIVLIDDFQYLFPKVNDVESENISRLLSNLIDNCMANNVVIVAAANTHDYDDSVLKRRSILKEINLKIPNQKDREEILNNLLSAKQHDLSAEEVKYIAVHSQGFTGRNLDEVLDDAETIQDLRIQNGEECNKTIAFCDIKQALKLKKPSIVETSMKIKEVKWSDIGGLREIKQKLLEVVEGPLKYPDIYKKYGIPPSRGILLYGPPGCSKTMIAKALATECNLNFISKNVSDIHNKYVGESEKAVHNLFAMARAKSPCIIFLDEIDALTPGRGSSGGSGVEERIVNSFLQEMDGVEELHDVLIVAATNRPDRLDDAFVRHGRIDHFIYVPLPDADTREEIFRLRMKNRAISCDFDFKYLASKTEGYSGAEIVNVCNEAAFVLLAEDMECELPVFTIKHMEKALKTIIPRTTKEMLNFYKNFNSKCDLRIE